MSVTIETISVPDIGPFQMELKIAADIRIAAETARRKVGKFVGNHIADLLSGETPDLVFQHNEAYWRVPIILTSRTLGRIGIVGAIDVNVKTGQLSPDDLTIQEIKTNANRLAASTAL